MKPISIINKLNEAHKYEDYYSDIEDCKIKLSNAEIGEDIKSSKQIDDFVADSLPDELFKEYKKKVKGISDLNQKVNTAVDYLGSVMSEIEAESDEEDVNDKTGKETKKIDDKLKLEINEIHELYDEIYKVGEEYYKVISSNFNSVVDGLLKSLEDYFNAKLTKLTRDSIHLEREEFNYEVLENGSVDFVGRVWFKNEYLDKFGLSLNVRLNMSIAGDDGLKYEFNYITTDYIDKYSSKYTRYYKKVLEQLKNRLSLAESNKVVVYGNIEVGNWEQVQAGTRLSVEYRPDGTLNILKQKYFDK